MLTDELRKDLERQQYRIVGNHSTVKPCHWTKSMMKGEGECYKYTFYGIRSHRCLQMSTALSCANRCLFCWRGHKEPVTKTWEGPIDEPEMILNESIKEHADILVGFKGNSKVSKKMFEEATDPKHVALSLIGEPIIYPRLNEYLDLCNKRGISTFMVTNGQYPKAMNEMNQVSQLYLSVDAPNKELLKKIDVPLFEDYWERLEKSLDILAKRKDRTAIRITIIKDMNDVEAENYAKLIAKGNPDFVEIKGYVFVGASRERLTKENMPLHEEVIEFSKKIAEYLPDYELNAEHIRSRVALLTHKKYKQKNEFEKTEWNTWIDFKKWEKLSTEDIENKGIEFTEYNEKTPENFIGISGKKTEDIMTPHKKKKLAKENNEKNKISREVCSEIDLE